MYEISTEGYDFYCFFNRNKLGRFSNGNEKFPNYSKSNLALVILSFGL